MPCLLFKAIKFESRETEDLRVTAANVSLPQPPTPVLKRERLQRVIGNTGSDMKATFCSWMLTHYTIKLTIIIYNDDDTQILIIIPHYFIIVLCINI